MAETTVPWWRRALQYALGGIRSGFGLFQRGAKAEEDQAGVGAGGGEKVLVVAGVGPAGGARERLIESPAGGEGQAEELAREIPLPVVVGGKAGKTAAVGATSDGVGDSSKADERTEEPIEEKVEPQAGEAREIELGGGAVKSVVAVEVEAEPKVDAAESGKEAVEAVGEPAAAEMAEEEVIPDETVEAAGVEAEAAKDQEQAAEVRVEDAKSEEGHFELGVAADEVGEQEPMAQEANAEGVISPAPEEPKGVEPAEENLAVENPVLEERGAANKLEEVVDAEDEEAAKDLGHVAEISGAEAELPEPVETVEEQEKREAEGQESEVGEESIEKKASQVGIEDGPGTSEIHREIEAGPERIETTVDAERVLADNVTIEEPIDEKKPEEFRAVEAEATVAATVADEPEEQVEVEKAAAVAAGEVVASVHGAEPQAVAGSAEPEIEHVGAAVKPEEVEAHALVAEEPVIEEESEMEKPVHAESELTEEASHLEAPAIEEAIETGGMEQTIAPHAVESATEDEAAEHAAEPAVILEAVSEVRTGDAVAAREPEAEVKAESVIVETAAAEVVAVPAQLELIPKPPVDEKAAAKKAEQEKRRKEAEEESPFSVMVDHVYDGPLDLLLDLIRKQDIDIYDIPIAKITAQFLAYVNQLKASDVDVAGEFIYTASLLIHIKSKMLLPRTAEAPGEAADDPRRELVERLLEHEQFKNAAQMLQQKQMMEAASWSNPGLKEFVDDEGAEPEIAADTVDLVRVFREILERARTRPVLDVREDTVTVGQMIKFLGRRLTMEDKPIALRKLLSHTRSERALIAMFLALLELVRLQAILLRQDKAFSEIFVKKHSGFDSVMNDGLASARDDWR